MKRRNRRKGEGEPADGKQNKTTKLSGTGLSTIGPRRRRYQRSQRQRPPSTQRTNWNRSRRKPNTTTHTTIFDAPGNKPANVPKQDVDTKSFVAGSFDICPNWRNPQLALGFHSVWEPLRCHRILSELTRWLTKATD